jgi:quinol monooxygenase YgiN
MTVFNVVRFRVKLGREQEFLDAHVKATRSFSGARRTVMIRTGERSFCLIGEWDDMHSLVKARPAMIGVLDTFRNTLESLGDTQGVTDAVSGEVVLALGS